jgi:pyridoxamine 5'-phosphate oxidase-like protein
MGRVYERIDEHQREWISKQSMFFVGTAPSGDGGHVNVSPKGPIGSLKVVDDHTVAYLDIVGSGAETIAHVRDNGRICVMFCAFDGPPRIEPLLALGFHEPEIAESMRAIIRVDVTRIADSCGYGVPLMSYEGERSHMDLSTAKRIKVEGAGAMRRYEQAHNRESIDGLPALS